MITFLIYFLLNSCVAINLKSFLNKKWNRSFVYKTNVLIYISGNNDLSDYANNTMTWLAAGIDKIDPNLNVYIFCDGRYRPNKNGDDPNRRNGNTVDINEAGIYTIKGNSVVLLENLGKVPSGSVGRLKIFLNSVELAETNILILWGHSEGLPLIANLSNISNSGMSGNQFYSESEDDAKTKMGMSLDEICAAIDEFNERLNQVVAKKRLDILCFDACSIMSGEIPEMLKDRAKYFISSQDRQNGLSWNYKDFLAKLNRDIYLSNEEIVSHIVDTFSKLYIQDISMYNIKYEVGQIRGNDTISAVKISEIEEFNTLFNELIYKIMSTDAFKKNDIVEIKYGDEIKKVPLKLALLELIKLGRIDKTPLSIDILTFIHGSSDNPQSSPGLRAIFPNFASDISKVEMQFDKLIEKRFSKSGYKKAFGLSIRDLPNIILHDLDKQIILAEKEQVNRPQTEKIKESIKNSLREYKFVPNWTDFLIDIFVSLSNKVYRNEHQKEK